MAAQSKQQSNGAGASNVAERAYEIWESEGRPEGHDMDHWLKAEAEASGKPKRKAAARSGKAAESKSGKSKSASKAAAKPA